MVVQLLTINVIYYRLESPAPLIDCLAGKNRLQLRLHILMKAYSPSCSDTQVSAWVSQSIAEAGSRCTQHQPISRNQHSSTLQFVFYSVLSYRYLVMISINQRNCTASHLRHLTPAYCTTNSWNLVTPINTSHLGALTNHTLVFTQQITTMPWERELRLGSF